MQIQITGSQSHRDTPILHQPNCLKFGLAAGRSGE